MVNSMLMKTRIYPIPHNRLISARLSVVDVGQRATSVPLIMNDDGLGDPATYHANPEHSSFAERDGPNCFRGSRVNKMLATFDFALTKHCWDTDKLEAVKICIIPYYLAFDDYTVADEKTGTTIQSLLYLQNEDTHNQGYPLWNGTDIYADVANAGSDVPGLTGSQNLEGINLTSPSTIFKALQYYTNGPKLSKCIGKIRFLTITRRKVTRYKLKVRLTPKVKRINKKTLCGVIIIALDPAGGYQIFSADEDSAGDHVHFQHSLAFLEWQENADMSAI